MKKVIVFIAFSISVMQAFSQTTAIPKNTKEYYLHRSENQKIAGWILLIGGTALGTLGITQANRIANDDDISFTDGFGKGLTWVMISGMAYTSALCGIPALLSSRKNARKAAEFSFNNRKYVLPPQGNSMAVKSQPTLILKIRLGK